MNFVSRATSSSLSNASTQESDYPELPIIEEGSGVMSQKQGYSDQDLLRRAFGASIQQKKAEVRTWIVETHQQNTMDRSKNPIAHPNHQSSLNKKNRDSIDSMSTSDTDSAESNPPRFPLEHDLQPALSIVADFSAAPRLNNLNSRSCLDHDLLKSAFRGYVEQKRVQARKWTIESRQEHGMEQFKQIVHHRVEPAPACVLSLPGTPIYD
jgi:hypothetical protein